MTDSHIRILQLIAHKRQRELRNHDAVDRNGDAISTDRRQTSSESQPRPVHASRTLKPGGANLAQAEPPDHDAQPLIRTARLPARTSPFAKESRVAVAAEQPERRMPTLPL